MLSRKAAAIIGCSALVVAISMGVRQSFGIFLQPISHSLGVGRETFSLAVAGQNLIFGLPLIGLIADKFGARWVILAGGLLYAISLLMVAQIVSTTGLYISLGLLTGLALSGTTYVVVLGAVVQIVPVEKRSTVFGIITAAGSLGMFAVVPGAQWLLSSFGWQTALLGLAGGVGLIALLAFGFPAKPADSGAIGGSLAIDSLPQILLKARQHSGYWLLNAGFFVCGFHVAFIATHLPAFLTDSGLSPTVGATALALIGLFNILGSYSFGRLGDRFRKKYLLGFLYFSRAVTISLFLILPISQMTALIFGAVIGFLWLATVPLTSGMVAQIFGTRYLSTLYGIVFMCHQLGAFLGVWLGGRVYDATGSYTPIWLTAIALGVLATLLHLPITDSPVGRVIPVPAK